jgi:uncharacterized protein (TIGR03086 family)
VSPVSTPAYEADVHRRAVLASVGVVDRVRPGDLDRPTPCAEWSVRELLAHMTAQHRGFAAAAGGAGPDLAVWQPMDAPDPVEAYRAAADAVLAAFAAPGALDRDWWLPELTRARPFPALRARGFHLVDYVVHAWDVARAVGAPYEPDEDVADAALEVARAVPDGDNRRGPRSNFAPALIPAAGADALDTALRLLGRDPAWNPPGDASWSRS